ncbi:uncharacterized protein [Solanum tuberosum]|uniref:DUF4057 domain-containing protein n=1 Tax=Solanum tuberosum TaxID=4113 RepID=M1BZ35_SOLTU|nr:PREDICTED: uncharacterized protein LOC102586040 [Solanum tuberosum]KAH0727719.1 hypothetical protein KY284_003584 [Solanum tuberosum]KAH0733534.1 hypothetical protein KY289_004722 [Solanum tuberosum]KAH0767573.1 hypothetical protein KY285_003444 [Solanum tuberosum]
MEKLTPARNSRTCTADLLNWSSEVPPPSSASRSRQPSNGIGKVLFPGDVTDEEAESLYKRRPSSGYKLKEMNGSNIFSAGGKDVASESGPVNGNANIRTSVRIVQQGANGKSQISFGTEEKISQKMPITLTEVEKQDELSGDQESKIDRLSLSTVGNISEEMPITLTEVEKQHELSGNQESKIHSKVKKQLSEAKSKELSGSNIFGPPIEVPPRSSTVARSLQPEESKDMGEPAPRVVRTSVKVSNPSGGQSSILFGGEPVVEPVKKIHNQKVAELNGNGIFKGDTVTPPGSSEKSLSRSKLREMSGSGIFSDGKAESRVCYGGVRKPPGGESSIRLF